jgi:hypothetical protein
MALLLRYVVYPDLDSIIDELEREATVGIIHNCERVIESYTISIIKSFI